MQIQDLEKLVDLVSESAVLEVTLETDTRRVTVRKREKRRDSTAEVLSLPDEAAAVVELTADEEAVAEHAPDWTIAAPMVGYFYAVDPPVQRGSVVLAGQKVGAIESMKLMNDVNAERAGIVREVAIESGHAVEYGQPLFFLEPGDEEGE